MKLLKRNKGKSAALAALLLVSGIGYGSAASADMTQCAHYLSLALQAQAQQASKAGKKARHGGGSRRSILSPVAPFILDHTADPDHN